MPKPSTKKKLGGLLTLAVAVGCARALYPPPDVDPTLKSPPFYSQFPVEVGTPGQVFELDGVLLRALQVAANEYTPPHDGERQCWETPEALYYRFVRQGDVIFVEASEDPAACGDKWLALDSGAAYAISSDGRIFRRLLGSQTMVGSSQPESNWMALPPSMLMKQDGGTDSTLPSRRRPTFIVIPAVRSSMADGGLPGGPLDGGTPPTFPTE
jgi:hypothetical protein